MRWTLCVTRLSRILIPLGLLFTQCQERPFEERLIYFLHAQQRAELDRLMRQHPGQVRDLLKERLNTWTDLESTGASAQAQAVLQDVRDLAKEFDRVAQDGFWRRVETRAAQSLSERLAIRIVDDYLAKARQAMDQRQYIEALDALDQAERANRSPADLYMQAAIHHHRGLIAQNLYRYKEAQYQFETVRAIQTRIGNRVGLAAVQLDIGLLNKQLGRLSDALQLYREALEEQQRILSLGDAAQTLNNLGNLYIQIGDLRQGMAYLRAAVEQAEKVSDDARYALALNNLGFAHAMQHEYDLAESAYKRALAVAKRAKRERVLGLILNNFGELYFHKQQFPTAVQSLNEAYEVKTRTKHPSYSSMAVTSRALGEVYLADNRWEEAEAYITRALQEARRSQNGIFDTVVLASIYDLQGNLLAKQGRLPEAAAAFGKAVDGIETELADLKSHHWKTSLLSSNQDHFHNLILLTHERLNNPVAAFEVAEKARARAFLDLVGGQVGFEYGEQLASATRTIKDVLSTANVQPFAWAELRRKLPPTITVVEYTMTEKRLLIWVLNSEGLRSRAVALPREQLDRLVDDFRVAATLGNSDFKARFSGWKASLEETERRAGELYQRLIAPIKDLLPPDRLVCFVPDGSLYYVPFAALFDLAARKYLVQEYTIFYAPSASILVRSLEMQRQKPPADPLLMISNPALGKGALKQFRYLQPLADAEAFDDQIARLFKGCGFLRAAAATKSAVRAAMPNYEIVHFSGHSVLNDQEPLLSALVLAEEAGPGGLLPVEPEGAAVGSDDNGLLYTHELFQLPLPKTRLLVLSACETALGRLWEGEGMVGMARAVFYARVPSLIATQWKVADGPTGQLMAAFYQELRAGATIAGALAQAQRDYLQKSQQPERRHPYHWGGFCLMGSYYLRGNHR